MSRALRRQRESPVKGNSVEEKLVEGRSSLLLCEQD